MFQLKNFVYLNLIFKLKNRSMINPSKFSLCMVCGCQDVFALLFLNNSNFRYLNLPIENNQSMILCFLYRFNLLNNLLSHLQFLYNYFYGITYRAKFHLIGLTFGMGSSFSDFNSLKLRTLIVRMNQAHYTVLRLSSRALNCKVERKGWILRFCTSSFSEFYSFVFLIHSFRSLFPYKIKGFLFFSELEYQERNVFSGKQEKKSSSSDRDKEKSAKRKAASKDIPKGKRIVGRKG